MNSLIFLFLLAIITLAKQRILEISDNISTSELLSLSNKYDQIAFIQSKKDLQSKTKNIVLSLETARFFEAKEIIVSDNVTVNIEPSTKLANYEELRMTFQGILFAGATSKILLGGAKSYDITVDTLKFSEYVSLNTVFESGEDIKGKKIYYNNVIFLKESTEEEINAIDINDLELSEAITKNVFALLSNSIKLTNYVLKPSIPESSVHLAIRPSNIEGPIRIEETKLLLLISEDNTDDDIKLASLYLNPSTNSELIIRQELYDNKRLIPFYFRLQSASATIKFQDIDSVVVPEQKRITIVHTNDVHGAIEDSDSGSVVNFARFKTYIDTLRNEEGKDNVLVLDAGDFIAGSAFVNIFNGDNAAEFIRMIGYDAVIAGNHGYDFGFDQLLNIVNKLESDSTENETKVDFLVSNVKYTDTQESVFGEGYKLYKMSGVHNKNISKEDETPINICIIGFENKNTTDVVMPSSVTNLTFEDPVEVTSRILNENNDFFNNCTATIALGHLGFTDDDISSNYLAKKTKNFPLIIDGHSHTVIGNLDTDIYGEYIESELENTVHDTLVSQTGTGLKHIGLIQMLFDGTSNKLVGVVSRLLSPSFFNDYEMDEYVSQRIDYYNEEMNNALMEEVGFTNIFLDGERNSLRTSQTNLGSLVTSVLLEATDADLSLCNGGGLRSSIQEGKITKKSVYDVLPFGNMIFIIEVTGKTIKEAITHGYKSYGKGIQQGFFAQTSGITFDIQYSSDADVENVLSNFRFVKDNSEINDDQTYKLVTSDFIALGGDMYSMFVGAKKLAEQGTMMDAVISYIKNLPDQTITGEEDIFKYERCNATTNDLQSLKTSSNIYSVKQDEFSKVSINGLVDMTNMNSIYDIMNYKYIYAIEANSILVSNVHVGTQLYDYSQKLCAAGLDFDGIPSSLTISKDITLADTSESIVKAIAENIEYITSNYPENVMDLNPEMEFDNFVIKSTNGKVVSLTKNFKKGKFSNNTYIIADTVKISKKADSSNDSSTNLGNIITTGDINIDLGKNDQITVGSLISMAGKLILTAGILKIDTNVNSYHIVYPLLGSSSFEENSLVWEFCDGTLADSKICSDMEQPSIKEFDNTKLLGTKSADIKVTNYFVSDINKSLPSSNLITTQINLLPFVITFSVLFTICLISLIVVSVLFAKTKKTSDAIRKTELGPVRFVHN